MDFANSSQSFLGSDGLSNTPKRNRSVSVSGRLRSASILFETGRISNEDKNSMKDLILCQDPLVEQAFTEFESGDEVKLLDLVRSGYLQKKSEFSFLDVNIEYGFNSLSLNTLSDEGTDSSSIFTFNNAFDLGVGLPNGDSMPQELLLDDMPVEREIYHKRSRESVDLDRFENAPTIIGSTSIQTHRDHYGFDSNDGSYPYDTIHDYSMQQQDHIYPYHSSSMHSDSMDLTHQLDPMGLLITQEGNQLSSGGYMDTSTLTLNSENTTEERRMQTVGLTPIITHSDSQKKFIGSYSPDARKKRVQRFFEKRKQRVWTKKVKYDVRKNFADSRLRVKGRFVKKEDEELLRELMNLA